ncbi:MAG: acetyl-CoA carboxylase carboxyl transferase subunit alpha, partial [Gemmatimonadetes bacterium]|nr:acetyl-CoA carboxylase carboxyl transferase subunit alpha [Gemmatimonadota bacterium]
MALTLDFEKPLIELERQIAHLKRRARERGLEVDSAIGPIERKLEDLRQEIYGDLTPMQRVQVARHVRRPYTLDYIRSLFTDFVELKGDRLFRDDPAMLSGFAKLEDRKVMFVGQHKGRNLDERNAYNYGMANPEGYRKALAKMETAAKFGLPIICFIDTPGAYPGVGAEERGQAYQIAVNLRDMSRLKTPIICVVIGEGGSGGALGIGIG